MKKGPVVLFSDETCVCGGIRDLGAFQIECEIRTPVVTCGRRRFEFRYRSCSPLAHALPSDFSAFIRKKFGISLLRRQAIVSRFRSQWAERSSMTRAINQIVPALSMHCGSEHDFFYLPDVKRALGPQPKCDGCRKRITRDDIRRRCEICEKPECCWDKFIEDSRGRHKENVRTRDAGVCSTSCFYTRWERRMAAEDAQKTEFKQERKCIRESKQMLREIRKILASSPNHDVSQSHVTA